MMKIGIVTFFCVPNYGAMLQAYALWEFLKARGHEVEFVDYAFGNTQRIPLWKCFIFRHWSSCLHAIRKKLNMYVRFTITNFVVKFPRTRRLMNFDEALMIGKDFDAVIVGSDQMWNPAWCSGNYLPIVMLDFAGVGVKRISYAASFGTKEWRNEQNAREASQLLRKFDAISVREQSGVKLVQVLSGRDDAKWLLDPTLLHTAQFYQPLLSKSIQREYIFSYILDEWVKSEEICNVLETIKTVRGVSELRTDRTTVEGILAPISHVVGATGKVPVGEWLSLVSNANFVVTNSFHGTVFAVLFHKPFIAIPVEGSLSGMNERIESFLSLLQLGARMVSVRDINAIENIASSVVDWDSVDAILEAQRARTMRFFDTVGL